MVGFHYAPADPSIFDTIRFYDQSYDPAGIGIASRSWSFGDGATATGCCPTHRYPADGTYTLTLTVATADGRSASGSRELVIQTHDVSIARVLVPPRARIGETLPIIVALVNGRYPETVEVKLLKSIPGGGRRQVGLLRKGVPVRDGNRTTDFGFTYTFSPEDLELGDVQFQAFAVIQGARDARSGDNACVSPPTKVTR